MPTEKNYPYPIPAATGICNPRVTKMKRAYTGGAVEVDLTSSQALFKVYSIKGQASLKVQVF